MKKNQDGELKTAILFDNLRELWEFNLKKNKVATVAPKKKNQDGEVKTPFCLTA